MAYRWTEEGPALEFATPYATENRFLRWRGIGLVALALLLVVIPAVVNSGDPASVELVPENLIDPPPVWPHYLVAVLMLALGVVDLVQAARQQVLRLTRGEPASLVKDMYHEATGTSPGAPALLSAVLRGERPEQAAPGRYRRLLTALASGVTQLPHPLQGYLRLRAAHLVLTAGLLLLLGVAAVVLKPQGPAMALMSLVVCAVGAAFVVRRVLLSGLDAPSPWWVLAALLLVAAAVVPLRLWGDGIGPAARLANLGLPLGALVLLASGLLFDGLGLMAGRAQIEPAQPARLPPEQAQLSLSLDPRQLMQEIDRELFRRWAEGLPNRRYIWQPPLLDREASQGDFTARLFEETQPLHRPATTRGRRWLVALDAMGLVWALGGALLCVVAAYAHVSGRAAGWWPVAIGLGAILAGSHATRVAHLLWTRMELQSSLIWLELKGRYWRQDNQTVVDSMTVQCVVADARSAFYAAGAPGIGSRTLLQWQPDPAAARDWQSYIRGFGETGAAVATPAKAKARPAARESEALAAAGAQARPTRFCSACGTPVLAGARFCQNCGAALGN